MLRLYVVSELDLSKKRRYWYAMLRYTEMSKVMNEKMNIATKVGDSFTKVRMLYKWK